MTNKSAICESSLHMISFKCKGISIYIYINGHDLASSHCHVRIPEGNIDNLQLIPRKVKTEFVRLNAAGSGKGNNSHEHSIDEEYRQQRHQFRLWATISHLKCPSDS